MGMSGSPFRILAFFAIAGLLAVVAWTGGAIACPIDSSQTARMTMHDQQPHHRMGQSSPDDQSVPPLAAIDARPPLRIAAVALPLPSLDSFDPGLDPPPPRGAQPS
jgi:hypothetical protein